jgi:exonuclease III
MNQLNIMLFNATGLPKQAISSILSLAKHSSVLLIVETRLLSPNRYPTHRKQYHTYGIKTHPLATKGSQGISLLVNPVCQFHVHHLPNDDSQPSQYKLSFTIKDVLIHCVYFPPSLDNQTIAEALDSLLKTIPHTNQTIICGDFNARMENYTGNHSSNSRGNQLYNWIQQNNLIVISSK